MVLKFDENIDAVLEDYHKRIEAEDALMQSLERAEGMKRRDEFLLSVGMETAIFLNNLAKSSKAKTILEIGTSYGYSTIWLAEAAKANKGLVISLENDAKKAAYAQKMIEKAGLSAYVDIRVGDALETINQAREQFDFVILDLWKELYLPCFDLFYPKLNKGAWVAADNMIFPPHSQSDTDAYRRRVKETHNFDSVLLPIGSGIELSFLK